MKKTVFIILLLVLALASVNTAFAYTTIVEDYPELPACKGGEECKPGQEDFGLPQYIHYIFIFSLGIVGLAGLISIIIAGFGYMTAAGNPQKASKAKDQITSALIGLLLLLGSYLLLYIINPDLTKFPTELFQ